MIYSLLLQILNLTNGNIEHVEKGAFWCLEKLRHLLMTHNKLKAMPELCALKKSLILLRLGDNSISSPKKNYFRCFKRLRYLRLSFNRFQGIGSVMGLDRQLSVLNVQMNEIRSLDEMFMAKKRPIYRIKLFFARGNQITHFKTSFFSQMTCLKRLDLRENRLTHIGDFRSLYQGWILLSGNPWNCGQQLSWMTELNNSDVEKLRCETPYYLQGMLVFISRKQKSTVKPLV